MLTKGQQEDLRKMFDLAFGVSDRGAYSSSVIYEVCKKAVITFPELLKNKDWRALCFFWDKKNAKTYFSSSAKQLLEFDGKSLLKWDASDITYDDLRTALKAQSPLTQRQAFTTKKIKEVINNKWVYNIYLDSWYDQRAGKLTESILTSKCILGWKKDDIPFKQLAKIKTKKDWFDKLALKILFQDYLYTLKVPATVLTQISDGCKALQVPDDIKRVVAKLCEYRTRFAEEVKSAQPGFVSHWSKIKPVPLSLDPKEEAEIQAFAKLQGLKYNTNVNEMDEDDLGCRDFFCNAWECLYEYLLLNTI